MSLPVLLTQKKLKLPVIAAPMFLVSGPQLVIECSLAGVVGTFPALNQRSTKGYEEWLEDIKTALHGKYHTPFGVNLIVHKSNPRLHADLELTVKHKIPIVITSLGAVPDLVDAIHAYGGIVFHDCINIKHAEQALKSGVDGIIAVCNGAGGHTGTYNPFAFIRELKGIIEDKTIILSGSISTGDDIAAAIACGADLAYMGTRFNATRESLAPQDFKEMIKNCSIKDIITTSEVTGVNANFMSASINAAQKTFVSSQHNQDLDFGAEFDTGNKAWKDIWSAGHGVGAIHDVLSVKDLCKMLQSEYQEACFRLNNKE